MKGIHYSSRPYRLGDEDTINNLYFQITGRIRTREQWAWQWQQAPAGPGDIWLIEATHPNGQTELIGHHGIMPVRFTYKEKDLVFGKTENTMVLPAYRKNILYPRFERAFAKNYESRYHALFSTMGPTAAIRQRKAMGYTAEQHWVCLEQADPPFGSIARASQYRRFHFLRKFLSAILHLDPQASLPEGTDLLTAEEALGSPFLSEYWERARYEWPIAPRRSAEDLAWRYWKNPYSKYYASIVRNPKIGESLVVMSVPSPGVVNIEDFSSERPDPQLLLQALQAAITAARKRLGARVFRCQFTSDAIPKAATSALQAHFVPSLISKLHERRRKGETTVRMPRKLTSKGFNEGLADSEWNITMAVSEGRR